MHDWLEPHMKRCMKNSINIDGSINWMQHATVGYIYHIITQSVVTFRLVPTRIDRHPCRPYLRIASWSWRPFRRWITSPGTILGNRAGVRLNDATSAIWSVMVAQRPIAVFFGIDQYTIAWSRHKNRQSLCWDWCIFYNLCSLLCSFGIKESTATRNKVTAFDCHRSVWYWMLLSENNIANISFIIVFLIKRNMLWLYIYI